ncbi:nitrogen assimilation response regulator NtrX [Amorphus orientalis]|uniref:Two-component system nitrogen regulation response regulator NtrX n=1 Tax=Amorphus orientalis TaxID=649198 RepID=A0AAE3VPT1_9HYPH|nr:sigma-54 dependent transcriptional regulator [Amorphus orientalis]MDQ0315920.1 two-component system nitrogen regulation response regulator NtrX [Amorphus orientalis]
MATDILIVDDERDIRELIAGILDDEGFEARTAAHSDEALAEIAARKPSLLFLDIWLQGSRLDGLALLDVIKEQHPSLPVVIISGHGNIETAVSAIKRGAYDYIEKPLKADRLILAAERALEASQLRREIADLKARAGEATELIGNSNAMAALRTMIERVAPTNSRILLTGPSGAGKELVARSIHGSSQRANGPFVILNAATITPDRVEEALFGTESSNGGSRAVGALEEAHGGTLYLDEIADMPLETQGRILRVLVDQTFLRVGGSTRVHVDVRIISSSARDLQNEIENGRVREDLFHRLSVVPIRVPSLAERRDDIPVLVDHFMRQIAASAGLPLRIIGDDAMAVLQAHDWPGNIRQLKNNIERLLILTRDQDPNDPVSADLLPSEVGALVPPLSSGQGGEHFMALPLRDAREIFERDYLKAQINRFGGNISRTAEFVGMERSALHRKLKSLGIA